MKPKTTRLLKCLVIFYLVFNCILGISASVFASYLLIFREETRIAKAKKIVLCFLFVPAIFTLLSTILGWISVKKRSPRLLKIFALLLSAAVILHIVGCIWCFTSIPQVNEEAVSYMEDKFSKVGTDASNEEWWNDIQRKLKCCGLHGPTDYHSSKAVPYSCCGSDAEDKTKGSCSFLWQKGCSYLLTKELSQDLLFLGSIGLCIAFLQIPGIFITWCYANRLAKERKV